MPRPDKLNPVEFESTRHEKKLRGRELEEFVAGVVTRGQHYDSMRSRWLEKTNHFYRRRRGLVGKKVSFPWPGASNFVAPVIDMEITRMVSTYMRSMFIQPIGAFISVRPDNIEQARLHEKFFNWLCYHGMRDFRKQMLIHFNSILSTGIGLTKTYWEHRTRRVRRVFRRSDFLRRHREDAIKPHVQDAANVITQFMMHGEDAVPGQFQAVADSEANLRSVPQGELDARTLETLRPIMIDEYDLDPEDAEDSKSITLIMKALRRGPEVIEYRTTDVEVDMPRVASLDPSSLIVPNTTTDIDDAPEVYQKLYFSTSAFTQHAHDYSWDQNVVEAVLKTRKNNLDMFSKKRSKTLPSMTGVGGGNMFGGGQRVVSGGNMTTMHKDNAEGISSTDLSDLIEVWEGHTLMDVDGDGLEERIVFSLVPGLERKDIGLLKPIREEPYEHGKHPYDATHFEITDNRFWSSRSVGELLNHVDREITHRRRMKANKLDLMVPMLKRKSTALFEPGSLGYIPGETITVLSMDDVETFTIPDTTAGDDREELILLTWQQRITGAFDAIASQGSIREARTASEIGAIQRSSEEILLMRTMVLQMGAAKFINKIWDISVQYMPDDTYRRVMGVDFVRPTRKELRHDYTLVPTGALLAGNPSQEAQRAAARLKVLLEFVGATGSPFMDGHKIDLVAALKLWLDRDGEVDSRAVVREMTQEEQQQLQAQAQTEAATAQLQGSNEAAVEFAKNRGPGVAQQPEPEADIAEALLQGVQ